MCFYFIPLIHLVAGDDRRSIIHMYNIVDRAKLRCHFRPTRKEDSAAVHRLRSPASYINPRKAATSNQRKRTDRRMNGCRPRHE